MERETGLEPPADLPQSTVAAPVAVLIRPDGYVAWVGDLTRPFPRGANHVEAAGGARRGGTRPLEPDILSLRFDYVFGWALRAATRPRFTMTMTAIIVMMTA
jgi:hypothetical protein